MHSPKGKKGFVTKYGIGERESEDAMNFMTANGQTSTSTKADIVIEELNDTVSPFVMEDSVLSIGRRCAQDGYSFMWLSGEDPVMVDKEGKVIRMRVAGHIPYLVTNDNRPYTPIMARRPRRR